MLPGSKDASINDIPNFRILVRELVKLHILFADGVSGARKNETGINFLHSVVPSFRNNIYLR